MKLLSEWKRKISLLVELAGAYQSDPKGARAYFKQLPSALRGRHFTGLWKQETADLEPASINPFEIYFDSHLEGQGLVKWRHYFEIYQRHLHKFRGREIHLAEVGVFGGGSLAMWRAYFGPQSHIYGVDIQPECTRYQAEGVKIFIGDQQAQKFWATFKQQVPCLDVIIDDGGHLPAQQMMTLEETLPFLRPGGVFICEDIHGIHNAFAAYAASLVYKLNQFNRSGRQVHPTPFQQHVHSIHFYPFMLVIEKHSQAIPELKLESHGREWPQFAQKINPNFEE